MSSKRIRELNDTFRTTFSGGQVMKTRGIADLPVNDQAEIIRQVQTFSDFTAENDPHGEHDFGSSTVAGHHVFWKIDYYDPQLQFGSEDPADPTKTTRVLTIMLANEY